METLVKIILTAIFTFTFAICLYWTWSSQIDVKRTFSQFFEKRTEKPKWLVTRDPNKLYQDGKEVATVSGNVQEKDGHVVLSEISEALSFDQRMPLEYKRDRLKVISIGETTELKMNVLDGRTEIKQGVRKNVICVKIP